MGRSVLPELVTEIDSAMSRGKTLPINVYGTKGYGKSHIIAAVVVLMIKLGKPRVLFLPQVRDMADVGWTEYLRAALLLTFADEHDMSVAILDCSGVDAMIELVTSQSFILVADQLNSLEESSKISPDEKIVVRNILKRLGENRLQVRGFSANNQTAADFAVTQRSQIDIKWFGGFNEVSVYSCYLMMFVFIPRCSLLHLHHSRFFL
jgi:hypothetical protein